MNADVMYLSGSNALIELLISDPFGQPVDITGERSTGIRHCSQTIREPLSSP